MENKKKRLHPLVLVVIVLLMLAVTLCGVVAGLWLHGQSMLNQPMEGPELPQQGESQVAEGEEQGTFIEYNGKRYQYNEHIRNILVMGIDSAVMPNQAAGVQDQSDVMVLAALDLEQDKLTLIHIDRDTMCDMEIPGQNGAPSYITRAQVTLAYGYGDGQHGSCEMARNAVSNIFYGLPIHGYAAYYMKGIRTLNDTLGGVTVTILDDYPFTHIIPTGQNMVAGRKVKLTGKQAELYIRARLEDRPDSNELRMQRQKQYMLALISRAKQRVQEDPACVLSLYRAVDDYILTDLGLGEVAYLAGAAAGMEFTGEVRSLAGELTVGQNNFVEYELDQQALYDLMLEVFYTEVPAQTPAVS